MFNLKTIAVAGLLSVMASISSAAVVSISINSPLDVNAVIGLPSTLAVGNNQNNVPTVYGFNEAQGVFLASNLNTDLGADLAAGTRVSSNYVFFDPKRITAVDGSVTFNRTILGVIVTRASLAASDILGDSSVNYASAFLTGLETTDFVSFAGNVLNFNWTAGSPGDHIRVITAAVPVPAAGGLMLLALGGLAAMRRRKANLAI